MKTVSLTELDTFHAETGDIQVIVETPRGSRNKFKYDPETNLFLLKKVLPAGAVFPQDFGFIPSTLEPDGDPSDVLLFLDEPTYPGNLVRAGLVGVIEAEQTQEGKTLRNDRLLAVASECLDYHNVQELDDLDTNLLLQIEHFFISYNQMEGKKFKPIGRANAQQAARHLAKSRKRFQQQGRKD